MPARFVNYLIQIPFQSSMPPGLRSTVRTMTPPGLTRAAMALRSARRPVAGMCSMTLTHTTPSNTEDFPADSPSGRFQDR